MRSATSAAECVLPVIPHVNGDRDDAKGNRPCLSPSPKRNSWIGIESGGLHGSFGTYGGVENGIV